MLKEKFKMIGSFLLKNSKLVLPVVIILAVAVTVSFALNASDDRIQKQATQEQESQQVVESVEATPQPQNYDVPLMANAIPEIRELIESYYDAYAAGDVEVIKSISNYLDETEAIRIVAMSEYVESYHDKIIYTKQGPVENSYLAYVYFKMKVTNFEDGISGMETFYICTRDDGSLYLNEGEVSDEELEYIREVATREDVEELYNRVNVECNDTFLKNEELFYYIQEIVNEVQKATGEALAAKQENVPEDTVSEADTENEVETQPPEPAEVPFVNESGEPLYAKTTTTVNVRASDSEKADKVDKVTSGTKVEVLEQKVNGWSKVKFGSSEGYIKSEYLRLLNVVGSADVIGTVTATANVNVRMWAGEDADRLGVLAGGEEVELLARENGWCKINYNGQIGYVKEDFVQ